MKYTAEGLVKYVKDCYKYPTVYMWGGLMNILTTEYVDYKVKQYKEKYTSNRIAYLKGLIGKTYGCDCVGLIKSYYFGGFNSPNYDLTKDLNTNGMFSVSKIKGSIKDMPDEPGIILYMDGHVGVYIGERQCIECTWGVYGDGVVKTAVDGRGWSHWLKLPYIEYSNSIEKCECECDCECRGYFTYNVQPGDSFRSISKKFYGTEVKYTIICNANGLKPDSIIHPNDKLIIPMKG